MRELQEKIGYAFRDKALLQLALRHPSSVHEGHLSNQRLEFLGDSVLQLLSSEVLYAQNPLLPEGKLSRMRAALVQESSLHRVAQKLDLGQKLTLSPGEEQTGGREKPSVLADAVEALLGAIYLDGGLEPARVFAREHILNQPPPPKTHDYKTQLQELTQAGEGKQIPHYEILAEDGPPHARVFTARVSLPDQGEATGEGNTKKAAEQAAAQALLKALASEKHESDGHTPCD